MKIMPGQANGARHVDKGLTIGRADSSVHARDIEENARFQLLFVEAVLHEITDTRDALQLVAFDNWQMTNSRGCHSREHGIISSASWRQIRKRER